MQTVSCAFCEKLISVDSIKYWTADRKNVFCDAECSTEWFKLNTWNDQTDTQETT